MTDIEQQIAQASGTRKSTAILADPEHVTEPLQILPFVTLFFKSYSKMNRERYEDAYKLPKYNFARMLIGFTDPPNLGTIMNNGDYFIYWMQSSTKLEAWFSEMQQMVRDHGEDGSYWQKIVSYFKKQDDIVNGDAGALAVVVIGMFEKLDEQYRFFQKALIQKESDAVKTLDENQKINNNEWVNRMDTFLKNRVTTKQIKLTSEEGKTNWISDYAKQFVDNVLLPLDVGAPFPMGIGVEINPIGTKARKIQVLTPKLGEARPSRQQQQQQSNPVLDKVATERMNKETAEMTNNSVIEHYRHIIEDFGNHMMELFRSFNFPPVFTLDNPPSFTAEWQGYVDLAYRSFNDLARQRHAYLQRTGGSTSTTIPRWTQDQIFEDEDASALFAEFVGYKKAVPQNTVAPAPNVQRTNATYHYAINNMSLRFVSLYDYMVQKESERGRGKRMSPLLISSVLKKK